MRITKNIALHDIFMVGITIKGIDGIIEFLSGLTLLFTNSEFIMKIVQKIFEHELTQDSTDFIANTFIHASQSLTSSMLIFISIYLLIHGTIKIGLVAGLWYKKMWAYPLAAVIISLFVIYQVIRFFNTQSITLLLFTIIDIIILLLLKTEYRRVKKKNNQ